MGSLYQPHYQLTTKAQGTLQNRGGKRIQELENLEESYEILLSKYNLAIANMNTHQLRLFIKMKALKNWPPSKIAY